MTATNKRIELGDLAEDQVTKYRGVVVAFQKCLTGCDRFTLQSQEMKDGKVPDAYAFDATTVVLITKSVVVPNLPAETRQIAALPEPKLKAGGPHTREQR